MTNPRKMWCYDEITRVAEERIQQSMDRAANCPIDAVGDRRFHETLAFGVFMGWDSLTYRHQEPGDKERLEQLTERK